MDLERRVATLSLSILQGLWVWLILLPTLIVNSKHVDRELCVSDYTGWSLWLLGMLLECAADYQKYTFRGNPANKYVPMYYNNNKYIKLVLITYQRQVDKLWTLEYRSTS